MDDFREFAKKWDKGSPKGVKPCIPFCDYCGAECHEPEQVDTKDGKTYCSEACQGEDEAEQRNGEAGIPSWPEPRYYHGNHQD